METKKTKRANLENKKALFFQFGLIATLVIVFSAFEWGAKDKRVVDLLPAGGGFIEEPAMPIVIPEQPIPPVTAPPIMTGDFDMVDNTITVPDFVLPNPDDKTNVPLKPYIEKKPDEAPMPEHLPYDVNLVDEKPKFLGGDEREFNKWVFSKLIYPEESAKNGSSGKVLVHFIVGADGHVSDVKVVKKSPDPNLDNEAVRVISSSPRWTPGKQVGQPVRVRYIFPITFQIK